MQELCLSDIEQVGGAMDNGPTIPSVPIPPYPVPPPVYIGPGGISPRFVEV